MDSSGLERFDEKRNMARVAAGWKGSKFFQNGVRAPMRDFVEGYPPEVAQNVNAQSFPQPTPIDPWVDRRNPGK